MSEVHPGCLPGEALLARLVRCQFSVPTLALGIAPLRCLCPASGAGAQPVRQQHTTQLAPCRAEIPQGYAFPPT